MNIYLQAISINRENLTWIENKFEIIFSATEELVRHVNVGETFLNIVHKIITINIKTESSK